jgi:hypothetical protein
MTDSSRTDRDIRNVALQAAIHAEHDIPLPALADDDHPSTCSVMMGTGNCDCPRPSLVERQRFARAYEVAVVDRILRIADLYVAYIKDGATPEGRRDAEMIAEMMNGK